MGVGSLDLMMYVEPPDAFVTDSGKSRGRFTKAYYQKVSEHYHTCRILPYIVPIGSDTIGEPSTYLGRSRSPDIGGHRYLSENCAAYSAKRRT